MTDNDDLMLTDYGDPMLVRAQDYASHIIYALTASALGILAIGLSMLSWSEVTAVQKALVKAFALPLVFSLPCGFFGAYQRRRRFEATYRLQQAKKTGKKEMANEFKTECNFRKRIIDGALFLQALFLALGLFFFTLTIMAA